MLETPKLLSLIKRLLNYYTNDIVDSNNKLVVNYKLRKGFEVCLRQIFERVTNQHRIEIIYTMLDWFSSLDKDHEDLLELSSLVQYAAELYEVGLFSDHLPEHLMIRLLDSFVGSTNPSHCLVGCRLVQHFLDRQLNAQYLVEPKLYYEITETQMKIGNNIKSDREFLRKHKEQIHENFILAVTEHYEDSTNVKAVFTVVCCMLLEVPCGMTAASVAFMMMVVQNFALQEQNIPLRCKHWMHAIVISVMSLICWVHKAPFLCRYVNQIMNRRAKEAPQLNPPLLQEYHVRNTNPWTNAELFFEDWELRYGLWKAFSVSPV
ncbi:protein EFR3 homolog cmp44E-like isoform X2 [Leguminivora glycinivorella]|nr:protein EFR3 homolog cmp44E-like isoform X2 [Leguminivora glycinivorella]